MDKATLKNIIREEIKPYKQLLGEARGKVIHGGLAGQQTRVNDKSNEINSLTTPISYKEARKLTGLQGIEAAQKPDFIRWVMSKFGRNLPKDIDEKEVEKIIFSDDLSKYKTLNIGIDNPDTLAKLYQTKIKLNKELGSTTDSSSQGSSRMNNLLAAYDNAYAAEDRMRADKTPTGRNKNLSMDNTGGEEFDIIAPLIGQNSKQRAEQIFQDARTKFFARSLLGAGSLSGMAEIMEDVAFDAAKKWAELLIGSVKIALGDKNSRDDFSAIDFVEGINSVLGRKPDYSVPEEEITNEELTAIQSYGDQLYDAIRIRNTAAVSRIRAEVIRALVDDLRGSDEKNYLSILASVIRFDKTNELETTKLGYGPSRIAKEKIQKNLEKIADFEEKKNESNATKIDQIIAKLEAENAVHQKQIDAGFESLHQKLSNLATEIAELEAEALFYDEEGTSLSIKGGDISAQQKAAKKRFEEIQKLVAEKEKQMTEIRAEMNSHVSGKMERLKLKYGGGNVMKTFQYLVAKIVDKQIDEQLTDEEKAQVESFFNKKMDMLTLSSVEND